MDGQVLSAQRSSRPVEVGQHAVQEPALDGEIARLRRILGDIGAGKAQIDHGAATGDRHVGVAGRAQPGLRKGALRQRGASLAEADIAKADIARAAGERQQQRSRDERRCGAGRKG